MTKLCQSKVLAPTWQGQILGISAATLKMWTLLLLCASFAPKLTGKATFRPNGPLLAILYPRNEEALKLPYLYTRLYSNCNQ